MGRKDSDYFLNLQEEIEKSTIFNLKFDMMNKISNLQLKFVS